MNGQPNTPKTQYDHTLDQGGRGGNRGTIITVDSLKMTAKVKSGKEGLVEDVPFGGAVGPDGEGDLDVPMPGWNAILSEESGITTISSYAPSPSLFQGQAENDEYSDSINTWLSLTGTSRIYRTVEGGKRNFRAQRPHDLLPGDRGWRTPEGAIIAALRGGVVMMKATDLAQIMCNPVDDLTRIVGRNLEVMTDWGTIAFVNENGNTKLVMKGGSKEALNKAGKPTWEATIGDGNAFMSLNVKDPEGKKTMYSSRMDQAGKWHQTQEGDRMEEFRGAYGKGITGNYKKIVGGNHDVDVDGETTYTTPKMNIGGKNGEPVPMGTQLKAFLESLVEWIGGQMQIMTPAGPSDVGAMTPPPTVPDFNSEVVFLVQKPGPQAEEGA